MNIEPETRPKLEIATSRFVQWDSVFVRVGAIGIASSASLALLDEKSFPNFWLFWAAVMAIGLALFAATLVLLTVVYRVFRSIGRLLFDQPNETQ